MYRIALCENEEVFAAEQQKLCRDIFVKMNIEYELAAFQSAEEFLNEFNNKERERFDLLILDIMMDGMDGIELAHKIREADKNAAIIFLTSHRDFALQGYDVNALHYLIKPVDAAVLERLIQSAYNEKFQDNYLVIKIGTQHLRIPADDIICLETTGRRVEITLLDKTVYCSGKLSDLLQELPEDRFVRCHQAFAVNVKHIRELGKQDAITVSGKKIPVSRTYMSDIKKMFMRQLGND
ncbi:MAG: LytTR family DNA-binding domain-containing protein [Defluviitaleaceae bacterium]|nr:LytTR family DNA-binding domain-containing protein [Defluviitaleaceae bacterium]